MADECDDNADVPQPTNASSFTEEGRSSGKGRGYKRMNNNNNNDDWGVGRKNSHYDGGNDSSGFGSDNNDKSGGRGGGFGDFGGANSGGGGFDGERRGCGGDGGGGRSGFRSNGDNNGFGGGGGGGRYNDRDGDDDSRPRRRGGRGGGRGGFRNRDDDGEGGSSGWGGGGGRFGDGDDDSRPYRSRGGGRGGRGGGRDRAGDGDGGGFGKSKGGFGDEARGGGEGGDDPDKPPPVTYIPPEISTEDSEIFSGVDVGINFEKYDSIEIKVTGENPVPPIDDFKSMGLRSLVLENVVKSGYTKPTPVQKHAIPTIMAGRDLMACAQTGSGKTAAFLVPIIHTLLERPSELKLIGGGCEPHCVIVSPTRELAEQIWRQSVKFAKDSIIKCAVAYGGVATMHQGKQVANGCHILVATPGRLLDFVDRRRVSFASIRFFVLDEADRMLDMGFLNDIQKMVNHESMVPKEERQTLMFSATFGEDVQKIATEFLNNYLFLTVGIVGGACADVEQSFHEVPKYQKRSKLKEVLDREKVNNTIPRTLVFVEMKKTADFIAAFLSQKNFPTTSMHGDREQCQREEALRDFRSGRMPILVATAVAARGLDIKDVAHVVNYDMPKEVDEYVHRIGRTGRVGNRGKATSFFDPEADSAIVADLVRILSQSGQNVPEWLTGAGEGSFAPNRGDRFGGRDVRTFGNDGGFNNPGNTPNMAANAEPEEEW